MSMSTVNAESTHEPSIDNAGQDSIDKPSGMVVTDRDGTYSEADISIKRQLLAGIAEFRERNLSYITQNAEALEIPEDRISHFAAHFESAFKVRDGKAVYLDRQPFSGTIKEFADKFLTDNGIKTKAKIAELAQRSVQHEKDINDQIMQEMHLAASSDDQVAYRRLHTLRKNRRLGLV